MNEPSNFAPKGRLKEFEGDLSIPESAGTRFILIPVSDDGKIDENPVFSRWASAQAAYRQWYRMSYGKMDQWLGQVKTAQVQSDTVVVSLLCLHNGEIDYDALEKSIDAAGKAAAEVKGSIHLAKLGTWKKTQKILEEKILKRGLNVNVYI